MNYPKLRRPLLLLAAAFALTACSSPEDVAGNARTTALAAIDARNWGAAHHAIVALRGARPETPSSLAEVAGLMVRAGEAPEAIWLLEDAIARFPASDSLRIELARASLQTRQPGRAAMALEAIADDSAALADALPLRAQSWLELGNAAEARSALESAAALGGNDDPAHGGRLETIRLGLAALEDEGDAGLAELRIRIESAPAKTAAWRVLAALLRRRGRADEARAPLETAIAAEPDRIDLDTTLAAIYVSLEDPAAAERVLRDHIERHPTPGAHLTLVRLRTSRGDLDAGLARCALAVEKFPRSAMLRSARMELLLDLGKLDDARTELAIYDQLSGQGPQTEFLHARLALAKDQPHRALQRLVQVVELVDSPSTQYWLGRALEATDDPIGAESRYLLAHRGNPEDVGTAVAAARLAKQRGDWRAVARLARPAIEHGPHEPLGWDLLAEALAQLREWEQAEELARRRMEAFPDQVESYERLAESLRAQQRFDESLVVLDDAGKIGVKKKAWRMGRRGRRERRFERARAENADAGTVQAPQIIAERALLLAAQGKPAEGLALCVRALEKESAEARVEDAQDARLMAVKAALLLQLRREQDGLSATRLALASNPEDLRPLMGRARYYASTGRLDMARRDCESYLEDRPDDPGGHLMHGMVLAGLGLDDEAVDAYRRSVALDEAAWVAANNLAMILVERGDLDEALAAATLAHTHARENAFVLDTMGFVAMRAGQAKLAVDTLEQAREIAPDFIDAQLHLAEAYGAAGRAADGRQLLANLSVRAGRNPQALARIAEVRATLP